MTRTVAVLLGAGVVVLVIGIVLFVRKGCRESAPKSRVEIIAPKGTQVFERLPNKDERPLGEAPLTEDIRIDATIVLRYKEQEKVFPPEKWKGIKLTEDFGDSGKTPTLPHVVTVSVNATPWAEVFVKFPGTDRFVKPPNKKSNITPIRGDLKVPVGTAIKLEYEDQEKTFGYEVWKTSKTVSHDFRNQ